MLNTKLRTTRKMIDWYDFEPSFPDFANEGVSARIQNSCAELLYFAYAGILPKIASNPHF